MKKKPKSPARGVAERDEPYAEDGTDLTLIRWMLSLSPLERLTVLQNNVNSILKLRHAKPKR